MWPFRKKKKKDTPDDAPDTSPWATAEHFPSVPLVPLIKPEPEQAEVSSAPAAGPEHDQAPEPVEPEEPSLPRGLTPTRIIVAAAAIPSLASLVWTVWSVTDMLALNNPGVGLAVGLVMDLGMVGAVAMAWFSPAIAKIAGRFAWGVAVLAAVAVALHGWQSTTPEMALFGAVPLVAKGLWHLALASRRAQERAAASRQQEAEDARAAEAKADDASLTVHERSEIAQAKRAAAFKRELADARAAEAKADIYAEHTVLMAKDEAEADRLRKRYELAGQVAGNLPIEVLAQFMPGLGQEVEVREVPHRALDRSRTEPATAGMAPAAHTPAGFGAGLAEASMRGAGTPADLEVPRVPTPEAHPSTSEAAANRAAIDAALAAFEQEGRTASIRALAEATNLSRRTVKRHLES